MFPRFKKLLIFIFVLYTLVGFVVFPLVLKSQLPKWVEANTKSKIVVESLYFNPFIFKLDIYGLSLSSLKNEPLISFDTFSCNLNPSSLFYGAIHLKELLLIAPKIDLIYTKEKKINFLTLLKESNNEKSKKEDKDKTNSTLPRIIIDKINIKDGELEYKDFTHKNIFEFSFHQIGFSLENVDTKDLNSSDATVRFYSTLGDGGFVDFKSTIRGFAPFKVDGSLDFEASKLYTEWKYIREKLKLEVADGKVSLSTKYVLNMDDLKSTLLEDLHLQIENLRIKPKNGNKDILHLEKFALQGVRVEPFKQNIEVSQVVLQNLAVEAQRNKKGSIDWIEYTKSDAKSADNNTKVTQESSKTPWSLNIKDVALKDISLDFADAMVSPKVDSKVNKLNIYMQDVTLLGEKPFHYQLDMLFNKRAKLTASGDIEHKVLDISSLITLENFDIVHYKPYIDQQAKEALARYNLNLKSLNFGLQADTKIYKEHQDLVIKLNDANLSLDRFRVDRKSTKEKLAYFKNFDIEGIKLNTQTKDINVSQVKLSGLGVKARKYKSGKFNFENLVLAKKSSKEKKKKSTPKTEKPYKFLLEHFALRDSTLIFTDDTLVKRSVNRLNKIEFDAYDISSQKSSWLRYKTSLRVNSKGSIKAQGKLRHTPLREMGTFALKNIALEDINPYIQENLYARIDDGDISLQGTTLFSPSSQGADLRVQSTFKLNSLFVNDARDDSLLLSLQEVDTDAFTLELSPNRFYMNELNINSFYVNGMINEKKELNFAKLSKKAKEVKKEELPPKKESKPFPYQIAKINVALGSAKFADYSIPIKFKTHIHDLDGVIYSISNFKNATSYINISGEVDKYGSTRLKGSIDSANPKAFTDLSFKFQNLDLNALSGYSASFAGYKIDSGKLYLDLDYDIVNSELLGKNSVMLKKVKLGDTIEDENITVLPLGFVLGLLEDSDGIVDLNMNVEGNVDAPDFKYGPLVLKTFTNLITKAVTSPFKFLGSVMGFDAEKLENLDFEAGSFTITPPEREKLDQIAKIMLKKPKITLKIVPSYNEVVDKKALQLHKLVDLVMQKSGLKNRKEHESAMSIALLEDIYEEMREDDALEKLQEKLHTEVSDEKYERAYQSALISLCRDIQPIQTMELQSLAKERAESIFSYLTLEKFISKSRINSTKASVDDADDVKVIQTKMEIEVE